MTLLTYRVPTPGTGKSRLLLSFTDVIVGTAGDLGRSACSALLLVDATMTQQFGSVGFL
jgi:hypothetical protein